MAVDDRMRAVVGGVHKEGLGYPYADLNEEPVIDRELFESAINNDT